jgi:hypothetical protein
MNGIKHFALLLALLACAVIWTAMPQAQAAARARLIHVAAAAPRLDIFVNDALAVADLAYGESSAYFSLPMGAAGLKATIAGTNAQLLLETLSFESDFNTVLLWSAGDARLTVFPEDLSPLDIGMSRLQIVNALDDDSTIDIGPNDDDRLSGVGIAPQASLGPIELEADHIAFSLLPPSDRSEAARKEYGMDLPAGASNILVIHGRPDDPQLLHAVAAVEANDRSGRVRFIHAVPGAAPVDLKIDDHMIVPSLAFGVPTEHIVLPGGKHELSISLGGTVVSSMNLSVTAGQLQTVVLMGTPAALKVQQYQDSTRDLSESTAVVSLINAVPNSSVSRLQLASGAIVAVDVGYGEEAGAAQIAPGKHSMSMVQEIGDERGTIAAPSTHFYAGSYYNLIAMSGNAFTAPRLLIAETSLMRRASPSLPISSAANEDTKEMGAEEASEETETAQTTEPTEPERTADATSARETTDQQEPADDALEGAESKPAGADDAPVDAGPTLVMGPYAIVDLDASARLQLRQYPSLEALSLGLVPGQTELIVLGRRGLTEIYPGEIADIPIDFSDYTSDPAAALYPAQDLPKAETWLFVMYRTEDGGALLGWVNAYFLQVFDESGLRQRLASLPMVRQNRAGSTFNTVAQPPDLADYVSARVYRLNPDALLNMRVANDVESEVMMQLAPKAELSLIGLDETDAWAFVEYVAESGQVFRGWVSAAYVQLLLNGVPVPPNTLRSLDESVAPQIGNHIRGSIRQLEDSGPTPIPADDQIMTGIVGEVVLDPGAMLHLRRDPDANSESLALIPAGAMVSINGVTEDAQWVKTSYAERDGWVYAHYVALLLRGRRYDRSYVIGLLPAHDNLGNPAG